MSAVVVFCGSTLDRRAAARILPAIYRPPAAQSDIAKVVLASRPRAVGLIDGVFGTAPAVTHKEILWAMSEGVHVIGGGGVGALRASELGAFGMAGVGKVFRAFRDGTIEDDDEIAVIKPRHSSGPLTSQEALVNIRATLCRACEEGIIDASSHANLIGLAKKMFYGDRSYDALLKGAKARGIARVTEVRLREWLPAGRVNQMREDAMDMLRTIRDRLKSGLPPKEVSFRIEPAKIWVERLATFQEKTS